MEIRDLTDDEARAALVLKWGDVEPDVLPAWVAEMDYALAPPVAEALVAAVTTGVTGYPSLGAGGARLGASYAGFAARQFGHDVDATQVLPVVDVTAGVRLALDAVCEAGPMVMPVPGYRPQLEVAQVTGRERFDLTLDPDAEHAELDLDLLDHHFSRGARSLLLTQPHNPWGRAFTRTELEGVRDVVLRHGATVVSDEIHAPLALPGATHLPYLAVEGTAAHTVALVAASKAFNTAGLRCAQLVTADRSLHERLTAVPDARNDSWSTLGVVAAVAAYEEGDAWLDALRTRLGEQRDLLVDLLATHLPQARMRRPEATYLAWVDLRAYGHDDPAAVALARGRVKLAPGHDYQPGLAGHVRLNFATSPARLREVVRRLALAVAP